MNMAERGFEAFRIAARRVEVGMTNARNAARQAGPHADYEHGYADAYEQAWQDIIGAAIRTGTPL